MAQDPEIVHNYVTAHEAYLAATGDSHDPDDPAVIDARESYRANLAAYILDLETNGMSVPATLTDAMAALPPL
jgi:hypothetical protein